MGVQLTYSTAGGITIHNIIIQEDVLSLNHVTIIIGTSLTATSELDTSVKVSI